MFCALCISVLRAFSTVAFVTFFFAFDPEGWFYSSSLCHLLTKPSLQMPGSRLDNFSSTSCFALVIFGYMKVRRLYIPWRDLKIVANQLRLREDMVQFWYEYIHPSCYISQLLGNTDSFREHLIKAYSSRNTLYIWTNPCASQVDTFPIVFQIDNLDRLATSCWRELG